MLENGTMVPEHFHVTEVGVVTKHFIDCGGTVRNERIAEALSAMSGWPTFNYGMPTTTTIV